MNIHLPNGNSEPIRALVLSGGGGRGAFQCGVLEKLAEYGWVPDILVGTSIGSMNAAVYALKGIMGVVEMWRHIRTRDMHRFWRLRPWNSLLDRKPWKQTLERFAPEEELARVLWPLYIVTTNTDTGHPVIYTNDRDLDREKPIYQKVEAITHEHLLASSSIPYVYARTPVVLGRSSERGDAHADEHWDGAVMYNSPLRPAIESGADEIIVVLLSPYHDLDTSPANGHLPHIPRGAMSKLGYLLDLALMATFENDFAQTRSINRRVWSNPQAAEALGYKMVRCSLIGPPEWLTAADILLYRGKRIDQLREMGQRAAEHTWERMAQHGWDSMRGFG
jgi:NTE family protein